MEDFFEKIKKVADPPPNTDIFHVQDSLREVLLFFKQHEIITSKVPFIIRQEQQINVQGIRFHACLQQSIAQSNKLETHAESVIDYIEILKDPVFDSSRILSVLKSLLENTRRNMEETQKIKDEYSDIRDKLIEINDNRYAQDIQDNERIQSLPEDREELSNLKGSRKIIIAMIYIFIIIGFILIVVDINSNSKCESGGIGFTMMVISGPTYLYLKRKNSQIRKIKNKIKELEDLESLKNARSEIDTSQLCEKIYQTIVQVGAFNTYWMSQYYILEELNDNIKNEEDNLKSNTLPDQVRTVLKGPMRNRWEQVKTHCDNYTKTVRRLLVEV